MIERLLSPAVSTFLIKGNPGTGKSTLAMDILRTNGRGTYVSTRVSKEKMAMQNSQISVASVGGSQLEISVGGTAVDAQDFRLAAAKNIVRLVIEKINSDHRGVIVLDSWDSIAKEMDQVERLRTEKTLVAAVESSDSKLCFISEEPALTTTDYLVDAIVELRSELRNSQIKRTLEIKKLRGEAISDPVRLYTLETGRFVICPPTRALLLGQYEPKPYQAIPNPRNRYSSGSSSLDTLLGGGYRPGAVTAIEFGQGVSVTNMQPLASVIMANFLSNGGCVVALPPSGVPPEAILEPLRAILPRELVDSGVRLGYYDKYDDNCVFTLDSNSSEATFAKMWQTIDLLKGDSRRPCFIEIGVEKLEYLHGQGPMKQIVTSTARVKHNGDLAMLLVGNTTKIKDSITSVADAHVLFETYTNTLTSQSLKPLARMLSVSYDYSKGYPQVTWLPIT